MSLIAILCREKPYCRILGPIQHLLMLFLLGSAVSFAQSISGTVVDETGSLPGVNVYVKGTTIGTTTDFDGKFTLNLKSNSGEMFPDPSVNFLLLLEEL